MSGQAKEALTSRKDIESNTHHSLYNGKVYIAEWWLYLHVLWKDMPSHITFSSLGLLYSPEIETCVEFRHNWFCYVFLRQGKHSETIFIEIRSNEMYALFVPDFDKIMNNEKLCLTPMMFGSMQGVMATQISSSLILHIDA